MDQKVREYAGFYGIRSLCKIFRVADGHACAGLIRHMRFIRHGDLSDRPPRHDEIYRKRRELCYEA